MQRSFTHRHAAVPIFGADGYGQRQVFPTVPVRIVQVGVTFLFGIAISHWGLAALGLSGLLGLSACLALTIMAVDTRKAWARHIRQWR